MGNEEYRILLSHGPSKFEVTVCGAMTLAELSLKVSSHISLRENLHYEVHGKLVAIFQFVSFIFKLLNIFPFL